MEKKKIIAVCSLKGGVGCSTVSAGLAAAFAHKGRKTLAVDLNSRVHALDFFFGMQDRMLFDLSSFLSGRVSSEKILLRDVTLPELWLCPPPDRQDCFDEPDAEERFLRMSDEEGFERMIIDLSGADETLRDRVTCFSDEILIVTVQNPASVLAAQILEEQLREKQAKKSLVINRFDLSDMDSYKNGRERVWEIIDRTHLRLMGLVPESYSLLRRTEEGLLSSLAEKDQDAPFDNIAVRLEGGQVPLFEGMGAVKLRRKL